ncbi:MAG: adenosine deaminase family protein [Spirochaetaceae bacterium]|nr:MAG: adenosine deaminase family protein [Spirochaetaceae bacterium]
MSSFPSEFLEAMPKTDLHLHLDGSLRLQTLIELAREAKVELPAWDEAGLKEKVFKAHYRDLNEYLAGFAWTTSVMQTAPALERVAYELAMDNAAENVRYIEVRFAPQLHMNAHLSFREVLEAVDLGLQRARDEINARGVYSVTSAVTAEGDNPDLLPPPFDYGIIVTAMRYFNSQFSDYFATLTKAHEHATEEEILHYASLELARATVHLRNNSDVRVVGFDLAGSEAGYPAADHLAAFQHVHEHFLNKTVHAGEAYGPESIFQAITKLHADRIGHGFHLFDEDRITDPAIEDPARYVSNLVDYIANNRITIEVCLTSNLQTSPHLDQLSDHSIRKMIDNRLSVTLCTDNRLVSHTTVTNEFRLLTENFEVSPKQLKNMVIYGFKRSFFEGDYNEKRDYVRTVINYYDKVAKKFGIDTTKD